MTICGDCQDAVIVLSLPILQSSLHLKSYLNISHGNENTTVIESIYNYSKKTNHEAGPTKSDIKNELATINYISWSKPWDNWNVLDIFLWACKTTEGKQENGISKKILILLKQ